MKEKTWIVEIKAEIRNFSEDDTDSLEDKRHMTDFIQSGLDISDTFDMVLGETETKITKFKLKLKKKE